jgi:hypothetical protein
VIENNRLSIGIFSVSSGREAHITRASIGFPSMGRETLVQILLQQLARMLLIPEGSALHSRDEHIALSCRVTIGRNLEKSPTSNQTM